MMRLKKLSLLTEQSIKASEQVKLKQTQVVKLKLVGTGISHGYR